MSLASLSMPTYCEPWPGKKSAMGNGSGLAPWPTEASCSGSASAGGTLLGPSRRTASCLVVILVLIQPLEGPEPSMRLYFKRSPLSSTSSTSEPVDKRFGSCGVASPWPSRTKMPPLSAPPTISQACGTCGDMAGPKTCARSLRAGTLRGRARRLGLQGPEAWEIVGGADKEG